MQPTAQAVGEEKKKMEQAPEGRKKEVRKKMDSPQNMNQSEIPLILNPHLAQNIGVIKRRFMQSVIPPRRTPMSCRP
jgi:hypothetical protein